MPAQEFRAGGRRCRRIRIKVTMQPPEPETSRRLLRAFLYFLLVLALMASPFLFDRYFAASDQRVTIFQTVFGLHLFTPPGSNRYLSILPFLTSWMGTLDTVEAAQLAIIVLSFCVALAAFTYCLPAALTYAFCGSSLLLIVVYCGGAKLQHQMDVTGTYLVSFSWTLIGALILINARPASRAGLTAVLLLSSLLIFAAATLNLTCAMLALGAYGLFVGLAWIDRVWSDRPTSLSTLARSLFDVLSAHRRMVFGAFATAAAMAFTFALHDWYRVHFPQYMKSNYSVGSYLDSGLSFRAVAEAFRYLVQFHSQGSIFGRTISQTLTLLLLLSGIAFFILFLRRRRESAFARYYLMAAVMWSSALLTIVATSQSAHFQLVPSVVRGRYFTAPFYLLILAAALGVAVALVEFGPRVLSSQSRTAGARWLLAGVLLVTCCVAGLYATRTAVRAQVSASPAAHHVPSDAFAAALRNDDVRALLGTYWLVWTAQHAANRQATGAPLVTPVTFRTESFRLSVFKPIIDALASSKGYRFACIEFSPPRPGYDEKCQPQIEAYQQKGGFPIGSIEQLGQREIGGYRITLFRQGLANPDDADDCTSSEVLFRSKPAAPVDGQEAFDLDDDSFIYIQRPRTMAEWSVTVSSDRGRETVRLAGQADKQLRLLNRSFRMVASKCRLLITHSHNSELFPSPVRALIH
jgi:hypothetical protein